MTVTYAFIPNIELNKLVVVKLILRKCVDIEQNPGPTYVLSELLQQQQGSLQQFLLPMIYQAEGIPPRPSLFTDPPPGWDDNIRFVNITKNSNESENRKCLEHLIRRCQNSPNIPQAIKKALDTYEFVDEHGEFLKICELVLNLLKDHICNGQKVPSNVKKCILEIAEVLKSDTVIHYNSCLIYIHYTKTLYSNKYQIQTLFNFNCNITNFPFLSSNIPSSLAYGVFYLAVYTIRLGLLLI